MSIGFLVVSSVSRAADYTGDGFDDLVVGIPFEQDVRGVAEPGAIQVIPGSSSGLTTTGDAFVHQNTANVVGRNDPDDRFGFALGAGDVDGDGADDLIVSAPLDTLFGDHVGAIWRLELRATAAGVLSVASSETMSRKTAHVPGDPQEYEWFGHALAVDDFDGDGYDDVVVSAPDNDGAAFHAGAIQYLRGSPTGLTTTGQIAYDQDSPGVEGTAEVSDLFGMALASGDFDADGYADLAVGIPYEDWSGTNEGAVEVMYGSSTGPSTDDELWTAGGSGTAGTLQDASYCGTALAVADFDGDGYDDSAIGCTYYAVGGAIIGAGAVLFVYGSASGLAASELWTQDTSGVTGGAEADDTFGAALTAGDYDGDGYDDVAIGVPRESYDGFVQNGVVHVLFGSSSGITDVGDLLFAQDTGATVFGTPQDGEHWGSSLTSGDYDGDGMDDLVVGSPLDSDSGETGGGLVNVFYGSLFGPSTAGDQGFDQDSAGMADFVRELDQFGYSLR